MKTKINIWTEEGKTPIGYTPGLLTNPNNTIMPTLRHQEICFSPTIINHILQF